MLPKRLVSFTEVLQEVRSLRQLPTTWGTSMTLSGIIDLRAVGALPAHPPPKDQPIAVMIHGFGYAPGSSYDDPHKSLFCPVRRPCTDRAISWPWHLGFTTPNGRGQVFGLGWPAKGTLWQAWNRAENSGIALAQRLADLSNWADRPIDLIGHSLGARVALAAVAHAQPGTVGRVLLMTSCEYRATALAAATSAAGQSAEFINISSRENDLYDFLTECLVSPPQRGDVMLGSGFSGKLPNWLDLQIDKPEVLAALRRLGHRVAKPSLRICHWSAYLRPGMMPFYRHVLHQRVQMPLLRSAIPQTTDPRWARLAPSLPWPRLPGSGSVA